MLKRIAIAIGLLAVFNGYAAARLIARWPWAADHVTFSILLAIGFFVLQMVGPFGDRLLFPKLRKQYNAVGLLLVLGWASYLSFGVMSFLVVYELVADILGIAWALVAPSSNPLAFDHWALIVLGAATLATVVIGIVQAFAGPTVRTVEIPLRNLPAAFDGFKIAQVSDLHVGPLIGRAYTRNVVNIVNSLKPDLIALTGDFVDGAVEDVAGGIAPIADLRAPHGVFFITGNHEYFWNAFAWTEKFKTLGARVLINEHEIIKRDTGAIILAGVTDYSTTGMKSGHASDPKKALAGAPPDLTKIILAHQPASYRAAHAAGFDLQISGHTHGGQYFPFSFLIRYFQRYYKGLNQHEGMWVYVNRGTGFWGPPLRAGVPSEISLITLRPEGV